MAPCADVEIREAVPGDKAAIVALLRDHDLRTEGILQDGARYWVAEIGHALVGAVGIELGPHSVLLRSAIVIPSERGKGIGRNLTGRALDWARQSGYRAAYCFSTDAGRYWEARGFSLCSVDEVVRAAPQAPQVQLFHRLGWLPTEIAYRIALAPHPSSQASPDSGPPLAHP